MKASQLETRPFGRVVRDPDCMPEGFESFSLDVTDRRQLWAFSMRLLITGSAKTALGHLSASVVNRETGLYLVHGERFGPKAIAVDPEQFGMGLGESLLGEGRATGIARLPNQTLFFDLTFGDTCPAMGLFNAPWMYRSSLFAQKHALVHPGARATSGHFELWQGVGRDVPKTKVCLQGASVMMGHTWGRRIAGPTTFLRCTAFEEAPVGACLEVFWGPWTAGVVDFGAKLALLRLDGETHRFSRLRDFFTSVGPPSVESLELSFAGPTGTLRITTVAEPRYQSPLSAQGDVAPGVHYAWVAVKSVFAPKVGPKRTLVSRSGVLEHFTKPVETR